MASLGFEPEVLQLDGVDDSKEEGDDDDIYSNPLKHRKARADRFSASASNSDPEVCIIDARPASSSSCLKEDADDSLDILDDTGDSVISKLVSKRGPVFGDAGRSQEDDAIMEVKKLLAMPAKKKGEQVYCNSDEIEWISCNSDENDAPESPRRKRTRRNDQAETNDCPEIIVVRDFQKDSLAFEQRCTIRVKDNERFDSDIIRWKMNDSLEELAETYAKKWGCTADFVHFAKLDGTTVTNDKTLAELGFSVKDVNIISADKQSPVADPSRMVKIKWLLYDRNPIVTQVSKTLPFKILKKHLAADNELDESKMTLTFDCERIADEDTPESLDIDDGDCIDVLFL